MRIGVISRVLVVLALAGYAAAIGPLVVAAACWSGAYALLLVLLALARQATRAAMAPKERTPLRA